VIGGVELDGPEAVAVLQIGWPVADLINAPVAAYPIRVASLFPNPYVGASHFVVVVVAAVEGWQHLAFLPHHL
jgi:hypothetical protein